MLLWPPLTGNQLSPVAPRSWVLPSGHTPDNRHERRAKPDRKIRDRKTQTNNKTLRPHPPRHTLQAARTIRGATGRNGGRHLSLGNSRYKVDIAALSETLFSEQGQLEKLGTSCTFFWSSRPKAERRDAETPWWSSRDLVPGLGAKVEGAKHLPSLNRLLFKQPLRKPRDTLDKTETADETLTLGSKGLV
ncbi:unnamed protein product [Schistocephalus solidus]|uniref:Uncharacterized protein n=1 Tax=Schistocephalus solidus TaxID=70667 RepID=A0A183TDR0_SCHSO|nr:unnamed protein product [Schistocephalus solidus]